MDTFRAVIDTWPSLQAFAEDAGVKYGTAQVMYHRDSIHSDYWLRIVQGAKVRKLKGITLERLASLKAGVSRRSRPKTRVPRTERVSQTA